MKTVKRYDFNALGKATKTEQGYLRAPVSATRTGVLTYRRGDGSVIRELRPEEEVFKADSMATLGGIPLTNRHPTELLNSKNTKDYLIGYTSDNVAKNGIYLDTMATITDQSAIDEIEQGGLREVSCGYECELEEAPGNFDGQAYDVVQRNIKYNHLAIVDKGRAGPNVRLKLDSSDAILENICDNSTNKRPSIKTNHSKGDSMTKCTVNGVEYECSEQLAGAIVSALEKRKQEMAGAQQEATDAKAAMEAQKGEMDKVQAKADALEKEVAELKAAKLDDKAILTKVIARRKVEDLAKKVLPADTKFDELTDIELKKAVVKATCPETKLDDKSEIYVEARFDHICETHKDGADDKLAEALRKQNSSRMDGASAGSSEEARKKSMKQDAEAWKKPINGVAMAN